VDLGTQQLMSVPFALYAANGPAGPQGPAGADGAAGATGPQGPAGSDGQDASLSVSLTGDTLYTGTGFIIVPGISAANYPSTTIGCMDNTACNYMPTATQSDNSCLFLNATCDDGNVNTTNDVVNNSCQCLGTVIGNEIYIQGNGVTDIDGNFYPSIIINGQEWMQENLKVSKFNNGDLISSGLSNSAWSSTTSPGFSYYNNNSNNNTIYGKLYNWYVAGDTRNVCPLNWHVPSDTDWNILINYLDGTADGGINLQNSAGGKLKSIFGWPSPNTAADNSSGFSGLPGGDRNYTGGYNFFGTNGYWWCSTSGGATTAFSRILYYDRGYVQRDNDLKTYGFSIRCLKD
jgi:uncharacterized protein (TIGR02145 family)